VKRLCTCGCARSDKGRAVDGRRAYRCAVCQHVWTDGLQGREQRFSKQRTGYQFHDTGAAELSIEWLTTPQL